MQAPVKIIKDWLDPIIEKTLESNRLKKLERGASEKRDLKGDERSFLEYLADSTDGWPFPSFEFTLLMFTIDL